jgi:hypothetical protein
MISASLVLSWYLDRSGAAGRPLDHPDDDCPTSGCTCERFSEEIVETTDGEYLKLPAGRGS